VGSKRRHIKSQALTILRNFQQYNNRSIYGLWGGRGLKCYTAFLVEKWCLSEGLLTNFRWAFLEAKSDSLMHYDFQEERSLTNIRKSEGI